MAGLLTRFTFGGLPIPGGTVAKGGLKHFTETYSSGDCSGFSPDSLFIPPKREPMQGKISE